MRALLTGQQMKEVDRITIQEIGIPSMVLMERAAMAVVDEVKKRSAKEDAVWCACGCGNNGADGVAAARMLSLAGYPVTVLVIGDPARGSREFQHQILIAKKLGIQMVEVKDSPECMEVFSRGCDILIDAVFGVGLSRTVEGRYQAFLKRLDDTCRKLTVAVDMPSGISSEGGQVMGFALKADVTVTFGWEKLGTVLYPGKAYGGEVVVADIGFPAAALSMAEQSWQEAGAGEIRAFALEAEDRSRIPSRPAHSNKGTFGKVLIAAGSRTMGGAAYFSALAAYRTGAGLVKVLTVEENRAMLQTILPEAVLAVYDPDRMAQEPEYYREWLEKECGWADVVVLGPGLGRESYAEYLVEMILTAACSPMILDADALNIIAANPHMTGYFTENIIITPHLGEMARLIGENVREVQENLILTARDYALRFGITCVLKDAATVTALRDGRVFINTSGNSAMAKAGMGDVLTGVIAGLIAQGMDEAESAVLGVYLHGAAGDAYREKYGAYRLLARELADEILC